MRPHSDGMEGERVAFAVEKLVSCTIEIIVDTRRRHVTNS